MTNATRRRKQTSKPDAMQSPPHAYEDRPRKCGDTPIISPFALSRGFWKSMGFALIAGVFMGFVGLGFLNIVEWIPLQWWGPGYGDDGTSVGYLDGKLYWIGIMAGTGFIVGVIRVVTNAPDQFDGFFVELQNRHAEPKHALQAVAISAVSLMGGVSMGPEAALVACGGAFGVWWARLMNHSIRRQKQYALIGMVAACGSLFPTPFLALLIVHELGKPDAHFMENAMLTGTAATISFAIFFALKDDTWLEMGELKIGAHVVYGDLYLWHLLTAALIGIIGGILGTVYLIMMGLFRGIGDRLRMRVGRSVIGRILIPTLFGAILGTIGFIAPLTLGSGMEQIKMIMVLHWNGELGIPVLMGTVFLKTITYGLSVGGGFVGGIFFPTVFMGACLGLALNSYDETIFPLVLSVSCSLAAVPGSFCPCPFTILTLVQSLLIMGSYEVAPIFVTLIFSYLTLMGVGIIWRLQKKLKIGNSSESSAHLKPPSLKMDNSSNPIDILRSLKEDISFLNDYDSATEATERDDLATEWRNPALYHNVAAATKQSNGIVICRKPGDDGLRNPLLDGGEYNGGEWSLRTVTSNNRAKFPYNSSVTSFDDASERTVEAYTSEPNAPEVASSGVEGQ